VPKTLLLENFGIKPKYRYTDMQTFRLWMLDAVIPLS